MSSLLLEVKELAFDIHTIKWSSHSQLGSDYDKGWNDALVKIGRELGLMITRDIDRQKDSVLFAKSKICGRCGYFNKLDICHCSACGKSFTFGEPDRWDNSPLVSRKMNWFNNENKIKCLFDELEGTFTTGIACKCEKCSNKTGTL